MDLILLPGMSIRNKEWIEEVEAAVREDFDDTKIQYYQHWGSAGGEMDFEGELARLTESASGVKNYAIFAKSAGVVLTLRAIYEKRLSPRMCFFVGSAIHMARRLGFEVEQWLSALNIPALFIQKTMDPAMSFVKLKRAVTEAGAKNCEFAEVPGIDHRYADVAGLKVMMDKFARKHQGN